MTSEIQVTTSRPVAVDEFRSVLERSTLAERRPMQDAETLRLMVANAGLWATAWHGGLLVGVGRSLTDFAYCCYLADLAVDAAYQRQGIGKRLIAATRAALPAECSLILLAAPKAVDYYPHLGFQRHPSAWVLKGPPL